MDTIHDSTDNVNKYFHEAYTQNHAIDEVPWATGAVGLPLLQLWIDNVISEGMSGFDVGCGLGTEAVFLSRHGIKVTALDLNPKALEIASEYARLLNANVRLLHGNLLDWKTSSDPFTCFIPTNSRIGRADLTEKFDFVTDQGCFHHMLPRDRKSYAEFVYDLLVPGGKFFLRGFSDKMPPSKSGNGPIRLSAEDILNTFTSMFSIQEIRLFDNLPVPHKKDVPQTFWFVHARKKM